MTENERSELLKRYREGPAVFEAALAGMTPEELDFSPADGEWSPRHLTHHTADSETTAAIRLRRLIAEDSAAIQGYDQEQFARRLFYDRRPIEPSLAAIRAARQTTVSILEHLEAADWARKGTHSEMGEYGVERWLEIYSAHCHDHAEQVRRAREAFRARA